MSLRVHFDWDPNQARANLAKHGVSFEQAMAVFSDPLALSVPDKLAPVTEERWITIGQASPQALLVVVHTHVELDGDTALVRIISARKATRNEKRQYENEPG
jgi:uncharacterized DUF497 family protein